MQKIIMIIQDKWYTTAVALVVFAVSWNARWITVQGLWRNIPYEPLTESVYIIEVLLWILVSIGLWRTRHRCSLWNYFFMIVAFVGFSSLVWADNTVIAQQAFLRLLVALLFAVVISRDRLLLRPIAWAIAFSAMMQSVIALVQIAQQSVGASTLLGMSAQDPSVSGVSVVIAFGGRFLRAYGTFPHPNILGGFLAISLFCIFWLAQDASKRSSRLMLAIASILIPWGLVLSFSRSAWIAALLIIGSVIMALVMERWDKTLHVHRRSLMWLWLSAIMVFNIFTVAAFYWQPVVTRVTGSGFLEQYSMTQRNVAFEQAVTLLPSAWLHGVGMGNAVLHVANNAYASQSPEPLHNVFGLVWLELGIIGITLFVWMIVSLVWHTWGNIKNPQKNIHQSGMLSLGGILALSILLFFDHYLWTQFSGIVLLWIFVVFVHDETYV